MKRISLRESMDLIQGLSEAPARYDFNWTIDNPFKDPGNDPDYEEEFDVGINYSISGKYRPAKITADPGDSHPAEYPELESLSVFRLSTGEDITDAVPPAVMNQLGEKAWEDADSKSDQYDDRDSYDPY
jgi:hypothetical protein